MVRWGVLMLLEVKNISYRYSKSSKWILKDVSFTVDSKERVALVGPSGYGKSTLSKIISEKNFFDILKTN